jgi:glycosyltransferase involved in cell wall biosynthesis
MNLSIILPCYNEEEVITDTYSRLNTVLSNQDISYEIIAVNDGSHDNTLSILKELAQKDKNLKIINLSRNWGHQSAVSAGLKNCRGEAAVIIDADLQDPPEVIPQMLELWQQKQCNVVYAVRKKRKGEGFFKKITASLFYRIINSLSDIKFPRNTGDFRLMDRKVINAFNGMNEKNKYIRGIISWMGYNQEPFYYDRDPRAAGETKYTLKKMLKLASDGIFSFSRKPLRLSIMMGTLSLLVGLVLAVYVLVKHFTQSPDLVPGWASTVIIIIFFGGVQLLALGIFGEYLGGIFDEVKNRPEYLIESKKNMGEDE